jgi:hypothetical protein
LFLLCIGKSATYPEQLFQLTTSEINNNYGDGVKTICFELDIFGRLARFRICVAQKQARLSDITPLARTLSTKLAIMVLDKLRSKGELVPCRKRMLSLL